MQVRAPELQLRPAGLPIRPLRRPQSPLERPRRRRGPHPRKLPARARSPGQRPNLPPPSPNAPRNTGRFCRRTRRGSPTWRARGASAIRVVGGEDVPFEELGADRQREVIRVLRALAAERELEEARARREAVETALSEGGATEADAAAAREAEREAEDALARAREGAGAAPAPAPTAEEVDAAAAETDTDPTEGQKKAGNYKKGHVRIAGLDIAIEESEGIDSARRRQGREGVVRPAPPPLWLREADRKRRRRPGRCLCRAGPGIGHGVRGRPGGRGYEAVGRTQGVYRLPDAGRGRARLRRRVRRREGGRTAGARSRPFRWKRSRRG